MDELDLAQKASIYEWKICEAILKALEENRHYRKQIDELQAMGTRLITENRVMKKRIMLEFERQVIISKGTLAKDLDEEEKRFNLWLQTQIKEYLGK